jgi:hypothetical protein
VASGSGGGRWSTWSSGRRFAGCASWRACRSRRLRYRPGGFCQLDLWQPSREIPVGLGQTRVPDRLDPRPIGTTTRPSEAVDSVDVSGDRHDVRGGSDELHRHVLKLLRAMLRAGVMEDRAVRRSDAGTPQGGVISPCLCNVYLNRLDRQWTERGHGVLVRYADDMVVMCQSRDEAQRALDALRAILSELGLTLKDAKTRIVELREGGEGLDFLGFHHRWVRGNTPASRHLCFLARWPSRQAMQHARDRIRELTDRRRLLLPPNSRVCRAFATTSAALSRRRPRVRVPSLPLRTRPQRTARACTSKRARPERSVARHLFCSPPLAAAIAVRPASTLPMGHEPEPGA